MTPNSARCLAAWALAVLLFYRGGAALLHSLEAGSWPVVTATVVASDARWVEHHRAIGPSMWSYELYLRYSYRILGRDYVGSQAAFSAWGAAERFSPFAAVTAADFPPGAQVTAHYNPANPAQAVLQTTARASAWIALLLGMGFAWLGRKYARLVEAEKKQVALSTQA